MNMRLRGLQISGFSVRPHTLGLKGQTIPMFAHPVHSTAHTTARLVRNCGWSPVQCHILHTNPADIGFNRGTILLALLESLYKIHILWVYCSLSCAVKASRELGRKTSSSLLAGLVSHAQKCRHEARAVSTWGFSASHEWN